MRLTTKGKDGESMTTHIPFGYCFKDGEPSIDDDNGPKVIRLFELYLNGYSLADAGENIGISIWHCGISRIITNRAYLGEGIFPRLISDEVFEKAQQERYIRAARLGRLNKKYKDRKPHIASNFILESTECEIADPILKAVVLCQDLAQIKMRTS